MTSQLPARTRGATRIAFKLARRIAARRRGRSALIATLIGIPIAGMVAVTTVATSLIPTNAERIVTELGGTEAIVTMVSPPDDTLIQHPESLSYYEVDRDPMTGEPLGHDPDDPILSVRDVLPPGTELLTIVESSATVRTASGLGALALVEGDAADPALDGRFSLIEGRGPRTDREVAVSSSALDRLDISVGGEIEVISPEPGRFAVVGVIEDRQRPTDDDVLFARDGAISGVPAEGDTGATVYLPDTRLDWPAVRELNAQGAVVLSRAVLQDPPADARLPFGGNITLYSSLTSVIPMLALIGGFALFEVCLLAGAAMLVGTRSDLRALATVASVGGDRRVLFRTVSLGGVVLGLVGGIVGAAVGVGAAAGYVALTDDGSAAKYPGFHVDPLVLAAIVGFALLSGWIASLVAARTAARVDVVSALRGSRRPPKPSRAASVFGVVLLGLGALGLLGGATMTFFGYWPEYQYSWVWIGILVTVVGAIAMQLGAVLLSPTILRGITRLFARGGASVRMATRDASRNSARSVPTLAAIASTVFVAVALMTMLGSAQHQANLTYQHTAPLGTISGPLVTYDDEGVASLIPADDVVTVMETVLETEVEVLSSVASPYLNNDPDATFARPRLQISDACRELLAETQGMGPQQEDCGLNWFLLGQFGDQIWVGSVADLEAALGEPASDEARRALNGGGAVSLYPQFVADDEVRFEWWSGEQLADQTNFTDMAPERAVALPAVVQRPAHDYRFGIFVSPATAREVGLEFDESFVIADVGPRPSEETYDQLWGALAAVEVPAILYHEGGPPQFAGGAAWIFTGIAALITLAASAVALGLARADARRDDEVLDAIGAPPRLQRGVAFWQAIVVAGIGTVLGAAIGLLPNLALTLPSLVGVANDIPRDAAPFWAFAPPWAQLALLVLALPLVIALGSWLTAGRRRVAVRRMP